MHMNGFFQNAYVTRNLAKGIADLRDKHGVDGNIMEIPFETDVVTPHGSGPVIAKVALVWVGDVQLELIEPVSGLGQIYSDALPAGDALAFHHVGMRTFDMDAVRAEARAKGWPIAFQGGGDGFKFTYLDTRDTLGHYLEYVEIRQDMWEMTGGR
jgi:hypothetical protein